MVILWYVLFFVLEPDRSLYSQGGFFTWLPAHHAYSALLTSSFSRLLFGMSGCVLGRAGNQTAWRQDVKRMKSDDNSGRVFRWKYMYGSFPAICASVVMPKDAERHALFATACKMVWCDGKTKAERKTIMSSPRSRYIVIRLFAEDEGFKPPIPKSGIPDFESSAFDHSANLPFSGDKDNNNI